MAFGLAKAIKKAAFPFPPDTGKGNGGCGMGFFAAGDSCRDSWRRFFYAREVAKHD